MDIKTKKKISFLHQCRRCPAWRSSLCLSNWAPGLGRMSTRPCKHNFSCLEIMKGSIQLHERVDNDERERELSLNLFSLVNVISNNRAVHWGPWGHPLLTKIATRWARGRCYWVSCQATFVVASRSKPETTTVLAPKWAHRTRYGLYSMFAGMVFNSLKNRFSTTQITCKVLTRSVSTLLLCK